MQQRLYQLQALGIIEGLTAKFYYADYKINNEKSGIYPNADGKLLTGFIPLRS